MWCNFKKLFLIIRFLHFRKQWLLKVFGPLKQQYFLTISLDTCCMYYSISHLNQKLCSAYLKTIHRTNTQRKLSMVLKGSSEPSETTSLFPLWYSGLKDKIWCSNHGWHVVGGVLSQLTQALSEEFPPAVGVVHRFYLPSQSCAELWPVRVDSRARRWIPLRDFGRLCARL